MLFFLNAICQTLLSRWASVQGDVRENNSEKRKTAILPAVGDK